MHATLLDTRRGSADKVLLQVPVHHGHDGMYRYTVLHRQDLDAAYFAVFVDFTLAVVHDGVGAGLDTIAEFTDDLLTVRQQPLSLPALLPPGTAEYLVERVRHIGVFDYLLDDVTFPAHLFVLLICCLSLEGEPSFLRA